MNEEKKKAEDQQKVIEQQLEEEEKSEKAEKINDEEIVKEMVVQANESFKKVRSAILILFLTSIVLAVGFYNYRGSWLFTKDYIATDNIDKKLKEPIDP